MSTIQLPDSYSAMAITEFGPADTLKRVKKSLAAPMSNQVLIKAISASVNPIDVKTRAGLGLVAQKNADKLPMVAGYDSYGQVVAIGDDVSPLKCGDYVVGMIGFPLAAGAYAEYVMAEQADLVKVADNATSEIAALPLAGLTAYQGLFEFGQLQTDETVVISAAAGGVGHIAVQLAVFHGAKVIAIASEKNHAMLLALGASEVIDYCCLADFEPLSDIDLWFDLIGGEQAIAQLIKVGSIQRVVTVPTITAPQICQQAVKKGAQASGMLVKPNQQQLIKLVQLLENNQLRLNVVKQVPLPQAAEAHRLVELGKLSGKIVLIMN